MSQQDTTTIKFDLPPEWEQDKEEMGVSGAEWVRRMIRLGRRQFGLPYDPDPDGTLGMNGIQTEQEQDQDQYLGETDYVRQFLLANLSTDDYIEMEELVEGIRKDIDEKLQILENEDIVDGSYNKGVKLADDWQDKVETDG